MPRLPGPVRSLRLPQDMPLVPERESALEPAAPDSSGPWISCPRCQQAVPQSATCPACGFPFICELEQPQPGARARRLELWRHLLGAAAILMLLTSGAFYQDGVSAYQGLGYAITAQLQPDKSSGITLIGPDGFVERTELVLGLIKQRTPAYYWRLQESVEQIEYLSPEQLNSPLGRRIRMEGIGAVATPALRRVQVLPTTAFPFGEEANDFAVCNYAATLIHELRHIELHWNRQAPGGWQEEVLCEQAALDFLRQAGGPPGLLAAKESYLADPRARRYQRWYDWYKQFD